MSVRRRVQRLPSGKLSTRWVVDVQFRHSDGRIERFRRTPRVQSRIGAQRLERAILGDLEAGVPLIAEAPQEPSVPTLIVFWQQFLATHVMVNNKPSEQATKVRLMNLHLLPRFAKLQLDAIGTAAVEVYKADKLRLGYSPKSINNQLAVLRTVLMTAQRWDVIDRVPRIRLMRHRSPEMRFLSFDEAEQLIEAAHRPWRNMIIVALHTGLRIGELMALRWADVDLVGKRIRVRRSVWLGRIDTPKKWAGKAHAP